VGGQSTVRRQRRLASRAGHDQPVTGRADEFVQDPRAVGGRDVLKHIEGEHHVERPVLERELSRISYDPSAGGTIRAR
jgi:hypothetical protein